MKRFFMQQLSLSSLKMHDCDSQSFCRAGTFLKIDSSFSQLKIPLFQWVSYMYGLWSVVIIKIMESWGVGNRAASIPFTPCCCWIHIQSHTWAVSSNPGERWIMAAEVPAVFWHSAAVQMLLRANKEIAVGPKPEGVSRLEGTVSAAKLVCQWASVPFPPCMMLRGWQSVQTTDSPSNNKFWEYGRALIDLWSILLVCVISLVKPEHKITSPCFSQRAPQSEHIIPSVLEALNLEKGTQHPPQKASTVNKKEETTEKTPEEVSLLKDLQSEELLTT